MAYTTQQLITNAFYLSNIVSRGLETVTSEQIQDGLFRLNGFIAMKSADIGMISYYTVYDSQFVIGQEKYFIPDLIEIETMTFFIQTVRYQMREQTRYDYFGIGRIEQIEGLPYAWHPERVKGGLDLRVYWIPLQAYPFQITGKFQLNSVKLNQDLSTIFDIFYLEYLMHGLAIYLCEFYSISPPPSVGQRLAEMENNIRDTSPMDLTMRKLEYFSSSTGFNYADAIIGRGWRPS